MRVKKLKGHQGWWLAEDGSYVSGATAEEAKSNHANGMAQDKEQMLEIIKSTQTAPAPEITTSQMFEPESHSDGGRGIGSMSSDMISLFSRYPYALTRSLMAYGDPTKDPHQEYKEGMAGVNTETVGEVMHDPATAMEVGATIATGGGNIPVNMLIAGMSQLASNTMRGKGSWTDVVLNTLGAGTGDILGRTMGALWDSAGDFTKALKGRSLEDLALEIGESSSGVHRDALTLASTDEGLELLRSKFKTEGDIVDRLLTKVDDFNVDAEMAKVYDHIDNFEPIQYSDIGAWLRQQKIRNSNLTEADGVAEREINKAIEEMAQQFTPKSGMSQTTQMVDGVDAFGSPVKRIETVNLPTQASEFMPADEFYKKRVFFDKNIKWDSLESSSASEKINQLRKQVRQMMAEKLREGSVKAGREEYIPLMESVANKIDIKNKITEMIGDARKHDLPRTERATRLVDRLFGETAGMDLKREYLKEFEELVGESIVDDAYLAQLAQNIFKNGVLGMEQSKNFAKPSLQPTHTTGKAGKFPFNVPFGPRAYSGVYLPTIRSAKQDLTKLGVSTDKVKAMLESSMDRLGKIKESTPMLDPLRDAVAESRAGLIPARIGGGALLTAEEEKLR